MTDEKGLGEGYASYLSKGSAIVFTALLVSSVLAVALRIILARSLSTEEYGLLFAVIGLVSFVSSFRHLGIRASITKFVPEFKGKDELDKIKSTLKTSISIMSIMALAVAIVLILLSGWLAEYYFEHDLARPVLIVLSVWGIGTMTQNYLRSTFRGFRDMAGHSGVRLARLLFTLVLVIVVIFVMGTGVVGISLSYLAGSFLSSGVFYLLLRTRHSQYIQGDGSLSTPIAKKLLSFGLPMLLSGIAGTVMARTDTLMLTWLKDLEVVGLYEVAKPSARYLRYIGTAIAVPLFPMISELWAKNDKEKVSSTMSLLSKFSVVSIIPAVLVTIIFPDVIINLLFGTEYLGAVNALRILAVGSAFAVGSKILGPLLSGSGHPRLFMKSSFGAAGLNVVANIALIPPFGAGGAAIATSLSLFTKLVFRFYFSRKIIAFSIPYRSIFKALLCGGCSLLILVGLKEVIQLTPWLESIIIFPLVIMFYLILMFRLRIITKENIELIGSSTPLPKKVIKISIKLTPNAED